MGILSAKHESTGGLNVGLRTSKDSTVKTVSCLCKRHTHTHPHARTYAESSSNEWQHYEAKVLKPSFCETNLNNSLYVRFRKTKTFVCRKFLKRHIFSEHELNRTFQTCIQL